MAKTLYLAEKGIDSIEPGALFFDDVIDTINRNSPYLFDDIGIIGGQSIKGFRLARPELLQQPVQLTDTPREVPTSAANTMAPVNTQLEVPTSAGSGQLNSNLKDNSSIGVLVLAALVIAAMRKR